MLRNELETKIDNNMISSWTKKKVNKLYCGYLYPHTHYMVIESRKKNRIFKTVIVFSVSRPMIIIMTTSIFLFNHKPPTATRTTTGNDHHHWMMMILCGCYAIKELLCSSQQAASRQKSIFLINFFLFIICPFETFVVRNFFFWFEFIIILVMKKDLVQWSLMNWIE